MAKTINQNGAFRRKKVYFSQVSNVALRDKNLSLKAKGLYAIISSYITLEDFVLYKDYLISLSSDKKDGFNRVWDELKANGYLVQYTVRNDMGQYIYEYELLDEPRELSEEEREAFEKKEANRIARNKRKQANRKAKANPQTEIPPMEKEQKSIDGNSTTGASITGDTVSINNTDPTNTDTNNTKSSSSSNEDEELKDVINLYKECINKNLSSNIKNDLKELVDTYGKDHVLSSIKVTMDKATSPNLAYLKKVCSSDANSVPVHVTTKPTTQSKNTNFTTTYSHGWDIAELEKREMEYIEKMYG